MILGLFITLELMIGGAMIFNYDFHGADLIALLFAFMVLYSGVVAVLTEDVYKRQFLFCSASVVMM